MNGGITLSSSIFNRRLTNRPLMTYAVYADILDAAASDTPISELFKGRKNARYWRQAVADKRLGRYRAERRHHV